jgi:type I restriction enzyme, S subunit
MGGEWRETSLGELVEIYDGPHATPPKTETGPVFLGISNLAQGRLDLSNAEHLSEKDFQRWTRRVTPEAGDVVFSYETRLGEVALIPTDLRCCLGRRMGLLRARAGRVDSRFLLYAYLGSEFQETLRSRTIHGSTVDRIPLIDMPEFPIRIPASIQEQYAIAHVLGALDDKIELNRRMNETLEQIARAIFKSWFVDFDPVRAKAEGRNSGLPKHIAELFPDRVEDSELGEIPAGWEIGSILKQSRLLSGGTPKTDRTEYWGGDLLWASAKDVSQCGEIFSLRQSGASARRDLKKALLN